MVNQLAPTVQGLISQLMPWLVFDGEETFDLAISPTSPSVVGFSSTVRPAVSLDVPSLVVRAPTFDLASAPHVPIPSPLSAHSQLLVEALYGGGLPAPIDPVSPTPALFSGSPEVDTGSWRRIISPLGDTPATSRAPSPVSIESRGDSYKRVTHFEFPGAFSVSGHHAVLLPGHTIEVHYDDKFCLTVFADDGDEWIGEVILSEKFRRFPGCEIVTKLREGGGKFAVVQPSAWDFPFDFQFSLLVEDGSIFTLMEE